MTFYFYILKKVSVLHKNKTLSQMEAVSVYKIYNTNQWRWQKLYVFSQSQISDPPYSKSVLHRHLLELKYLHCSWSWILHVLITSSFLCWVIKEIMKNIWFAFILFNAFINSWICKFIFVGKFLIVYTEYRFREWTELGTFFVLLPGGGRREKFYICINHTWNEEKDQGSTFQSYWPSILNGNVQPI